MKATFLPILGALFIASLGSTAMAGPAVKGTVVNTQPSELADVQVWRRGATAPNEVVDDVDERIFDSLVIACNGMGGGASSDPDTPGGTECYDPDGNKLN